MIVRLKVNRSIFLLRKQIRFNSMIVRLKDLVQVGIHKFVVFQFYDSPIKSLAYPVLPPLAFRFNSMIVRLKVLMCTFVLSSRSWVSIL